jgi:CDP-diacylglycerol---serine O-phosphatidyltransferase
MSRGKKVKRGKSHRGIYILPNIFTTLNLFFGFYAVIASINGRFTAAAAAIPWPI